MSSAFTYRDFQGCLAHFKANTPTGDTVELAFSEEEIERLQDHAALHGCSVDAYVNAVLAWHITEVERQDRAALNDREGA